MNRYGTTQTPDRPEFEIAVGGAVLAPLVRADVVEIDVAEEVNRHGRLALLLQNWDTDTQTVRHSDSGPFTPGSSVTVKIGYHSTLAEVFDGVVSSVTTHFPRGGNPVLRVEARSRSILLAAPPRSRQFADTTDGGVAEVIAADYGLTSEVSAGVTHRQVICDRTSDWEVLTRRAAVLGWVTYVRGSRLVFRAPATTKEPHSLSYGLNVTELHLTEDTATALASVIGTGWDVSTAEPIEAEVAAERAALQTGNRTTHDRAASDSGWALRDARLATPIASDAAEVDARAEGAQRRTALGHVFGTASVVGNPVLRSDQWIDVEGVGVRMAGPHYVTAARHRLSARGYVTELQLGAPPALTPPAPPQGGGLTLGVVTSLDDPDGLNRVRVQLPWRGDDGEDAWARVSQIDAGNDSGTVFIPSLGQEVLVASIEGDASTPVVLGALHNGAQKPPYPSDDDNHVRAIVTPAGLRIVFDDEKPRLSIETSNATRTLTLDDDAGTLTLSDNAHSIVLDSSGITIESGKDLILKAAGKVQINAAQVESKASATTKLESSGALDVTASATLVLKGQLVTIN